MDPIWLRLWSDQDGQATVEYILILSFAVAGAAALAGAVIRGIDQGILSLGAALELDLKTGRMSDAIYKN